MRILILQSALRSIWGSQYCNPHCYSPGDRNIAIRIAIHLGIAILQSALRSTIFHSILKKCADRNIAIRIAIHLGIAILQSAIHQRIASLQSPHNSDFILNMRIAILQSAWRHTITIVTSHVYIYKCKH